MASKRRISYQMRLFLPLTVGMWVLIIGMAFWQMYRIKQTRREMVYDQLKMVTERVADLRVKKISSSLFIDFMNRYYEEEHDYAPISLYITKTGTDSVIAWAGPERDFSFIEKMPLKQGITQINDPEFNQKGLMPYLYYVIHTPGDEETIYGILPYTPKLAQAISSTTARFWMVVIMLALITTAMAYVATLYVSRNIKLLRSFAEHAAQDPDFIYGDPDLFPHDELGDISRQIVSIYNQRITETRRRQREHRVAVSAIDEKTRIKRELTSNINHELKTPVGIIKGYIDTIVDNPDMDAETRDRFIHKIQSNVDRLIQLINDLTAITKIEGAQNVAVEDVNFHDLVFTMAEEIEETHLLQSNMRFNFDIPLDCVVKGQKTLLQSVVLNFVKNAAAYSQGTECVLELVDSDANFYHFCFYDNGVGVAPEYLPMMFDRFFRVDNSRSRSTGGTGLGLSIVQVAINTFGGTIKVSNRAEGGLRYDFTLPKA